MEKKSKSSAAELAELKEKIRIEFCEMTLDQVKKFQGLEQTEYIIPVMAEVRANVRTAMDII